ncbi:hypothetical protein BROUX41_002765 [Berkeleyomyces rouxiae]|uniref:uncharacterized protein n=1 Tax=Berkeleyomyces rouxiae TaxID=2035830 RepID=UPI003B7D8300
MANLASAKPRKQSKPSALPAAKKSNSFISNYFKPGPPPRVSTPTSAPSPATTAPVHVQAGTPDSGNTAPISIPLRNSPRPSLERTGSASSLSPSPASLRTTLPIIPSPKIRRSVPIDTGECGGVDLACTMLPRRGSYNKSKSSSLSSLSSNIQMRSATPSISSSLRRSTRNSTSLVSTPTPPPPLTSTRKATRSKTPDLFASLSPEPEPIRKSFREDEEIGASDEDSGDDSDDFMPLVALLGRGTNATSTTQLETPNSKSSSSCQMPRSKKRLTSSAFARSRRSVKAEAEFSLQDLLADAAQDIATGVVLEKSARYYEETRREQKEDGKASGAYSHGDGYDPNNRVQNMNMKKTLQAVTGDEKDDAPDVDKVLRAMSNANSSAYLHVWHFFDPQAMKQTPAVPEFPARDMKAALHGLNIDRKSESDAALIIDQLFTRTCAAPAVSSHPIIEWLLKTLCVTSSAVKSAQISKCLALSSGAVASLTPDTLRDCMRLLGARDEVFADDCLMQLKGQTRSWESHYEGTRCGRLVFLLNAIAALALYMSPECQLCAATLLLKLAADADLMTATAVQAAYMSTLKAVFENLDEMLFNLFAVSVATTLIKNFPSMAIRHGIIRAIPIDEANLANLRRRLAIAFLHDDPNLAGRKPIISFGLDEASKLLKTPGFTVRRDTDYIQLRHSVALLDIALDDGCIPPTPSSQNYDELQGKELLQDFNAALDTIVSQLEALSRSINDVRLGSMHSTDAKGQINIVTNRLQYTVRYGGALRVSIYDKALSTAARRPQKWSRLVKSGQAKEKGQANIMAFTQAVDDKNSRQTAPVTKASESSSPHTTGTSTSPAKEDGE